MNNLNLSQRIEEKWDNAIIGCIDTTVTKIKKPVAEKNLLIRLNTFIKMINFYFVPSLRLNQLHAFIPEIKRQALALESCMKVAQNIIKEPTPPNADEPSTSQLLTRQGRSHYRRGHPPIPPALIAFNKRKYDELEKTDSSNADAPTKKRIRLNTTTPVSFTPPLYPAEKIKDYLQTLEIDSLETQEEIIRLLHSPHSDSTFICKEYSFKFHSLLLKDHLAVNNRQLIVDSNSNGASKTNQSHNNLNLSAEHLLKFLVWLYTGRILLEAEDVLELACFVNIVSDHQELFGIFREYLNEQPSLCIPLFLAMQGNLNVHMKQIIKEICCTHAQYVFDHHSFLELPFDFLIEIFSLDLNLSTDDVLSYLSKWVKYHQTAEHSVNHLSPLIIDEESLDEDELFIEEEVDEKANDRMTTQTDVCRLLETCLDLQTINTHRSFIIENFSITEQQFNSISIKKEEIDTQFTLRSLMQIMQPTERSPFIVHSLSEEHAVVKWNTTLQLDSMKLDLPSLVLRKEGHTIKINNELYEFKIGCDVKEVSDTKSQITNEYCVKPRFYFIIREKSQGANIKALDIDLELQSTDSVVWDLVTTSTPTQIVHSEKFQVFSFDCRNTFEYAAKTNKKRDANYYKKYKEQAFPIQLIINIKTKADSAINPDLSSERGNLTALVDLANACLFSIKEYKTKQTFSQYNLSSKISHIKETFTNYSSSFQTFINTMHAIPTAPLRPKPAFTHLHQAEQLSDKTWTYPIKLQKPLKKLYGEKKPILSTKNSFDFREKAEFCITIDGMDIRYHSFILEICPILSQLQTYALEKDLSANIIQELIKYVYTGEIVLTPENIISIYYTASFLNFKNLQKICFNKLRSKNFITTENALDLLKKLSADQVTCNFAKNICLFVKDYFYKCFFNKETQKLTVDAIKPSFYEINREFITLIFNNSHLNVDESFVFILLSEYLKKNIAQYDNYLDSYSKLRNSNLSFPDYFRYEIQEELLSTINFKRLFSQNLGEAVSLMQKFKIDEIQIFTTEDILSFQMMSFQLVKKSIGPLNQQLIEETIDKPIRCYDVWKSFKLDRNDSYAIKQEKDVLYFIWEIIPSLTNEIMYLEKPITFLNQRFNIGYKVIKDNETYKISFLLKPENSFIFQQNRTILEKSHFHWIHLLKFDEKDNYLVDARLPEKFNKDNSDFLNLYNYCLVGSPDEWQNKKILQRFMLIIKHVD